MRYILPVLLLVMSCGTSNDHDSFDQNEKNETLVSDENECIYGPEEQVELEYIDASADSDEVVVNYWVIKKDEKFQGGGYMDKECSADFKQKGKIPALLKKIVWGGCNRMVIYPEGYGRPGCFML